ncbi:uracil-DNA glycosylase [Gammaproteobacteria bacterium]|nr:uracil-DNA glycosylase [Gammaproteobacteria bacterium]
MDWQTVLHEEKSQDYFKKIIESVNAFREKGQVIYPAAKDCFKAFRLTPFDKLKVVILGQDPYHGPGQAHGLCFSVPRGIRKPPSLVNIFKALEHDLGILAPDHGCLESWAKQGVLLLNSVLSVQANEAGSHAGLGWQRFTDAVISQISEHADRVVFLLWGSYAQKKSDLINTDKHLVLKAVHPSPLSAHRGFLTCRHFSQANQWLADHDQLSVDWVIES